MTNPEDLFEDTKNRAFPVRRASHDEHMNQIPHGDTLTAVTVLVQMDVANPDRREMVKVKRTLEDKEVSFDPKTGKRIQVIKTRVVEDDAPHYDPEKGHCHGGRLRLKPGDFLVEEDGSFIGFSPKEFARRFVRLG